MLNNDFNFSVKKIEELSSVELYHILQLRNEVFIVEQNCPYQDLDNKDFKALHLQIFQHGELVAYSRLLPAGLCFTEASIGRVITSKKVRGSGIGFLLMSKSIDYLYSFFGQQPIRIGAQYYAVSFYERLGFVTKGDKYLEDNIEHIEMLKL